MEKPYVMREKAEQVLVASWCRQNGIFFQHHANEIDFPCENDGQRFGILTNRRKAGVSPGFPDLTVFLKDLYLLLYFLILQGKILVCLCLFQFV